MPIKICLDSERLLEKKEVQHTTHKTVSYEKAGLKKQPGAINDAYHIRPRTFLSFHVKNSEL